MPTIMVCYEPLTPNEKASVLIASYLRAKAELSLQNTTHASKVAVPSDKNSVPTAFFASVNAMWDDPQELLAHTIAPVGEAAQGN